MNIEAKVALTFPDGYDPVVALEELIEMAGKMGYVLDMNIPDIEPPLLPDNLGDWKVLSVKDVTVQDRQGKQIFDEFKIEPKICGHRHQDGGIKSMWLFNYIDWTTLVNEMKITLEKSDQVIVSLIDRKYKEFGDTLLSECLAWLKETYMQMTVDDRESELGKRIYALTIKVAFALKDRDKNDGYTSSVRGNYTGPLFP